MFIRFLVATFSLAFCLHCGTVEPFPMEADAGIGDPEGDKTDDPDDNADPDDPDDPKPPIPACALAHPDYVKRPGSTSLYRFIANDLIDNFGSWHAAARECALDGAHLVVLDDADEDLYVRSTFPLPIWIGLSDAAEEGNFTWINGAPLTHTNWKSDEPSNDNGGEHFVEIRGGGKWNDIHAGGSGDNHAVCECEAP